MIDASFVVSLVLGLTMIGFGCFLSHGESKEHNALINSLKQVDFGEFARAFGELGDGMGKLGGGMTEIVKRVPAIERSASLLSSALNELASAERIAVLSAVQTRLQAIQSKITQLVERVDLNAEDREQLQAAIAQIEQLQNQSAIGQTPVPVSGMDRTPATATPQSEAVPPVSPAVAGQLLSQIAKGTLGQIPKLDRGAQYASLGVILLVVAVGVAMFDSAVG
ncbi:hypothetical protein [Streptomyces sp. bgisy027]|uniref:hypothetical protein n=1 Tax=Streptomyces sp. bgisy027 TaxID=3413770 RepID=UPI003D72CC57